MGVNPLEVAEYATACGIANEPAFIYWVPYTLRHCNRIILGVNVCIQSATHKYGVEIPCTIEEALKLDKLNSNAFWCDTINKEIENLQVAFDILPESSKPPPGYTQASGHL
eukprot:6867744-Ditylum_brightwellii.AAC.2